MTNGYNYADLAVILSVSEESLRLHRIAADIRPIKPRDASHTFSMTNGYNYADLAVILSVSEESLRLCSITADIRPINLYR